MSLSWKRKLRGFVQKTAPLMVTCREFEEFIDDYLDGTLSARSRFVFRAHLLFCRECRDYLASYERAIRLGKKVFASPEVAVPDEVPEDLVRAILEARRLTGE